LAPLFCSFNTRDSVPPFPFLSLSLSFISYFSLALCGDVVGADFTRLFTCSFFLLVPRGSFQRYFSLSSETSDQKLDDSRLWRRIILNIIRSSAVAFRLTDLLTRQLERKRIADGAIGREELAA